MQVGDTFRYVETPDVAFFYSEDKLTYLHLFSGKRYIISYSLDQLEGMLDRDVFFRVSRSCISNIRSIRKSSRYFGSRLKLYFEPECPARGIGEPQSRDRFLEMGGRSGMSYKL